MKKIYSESSAINHIKQNGGKVENDTRLVKIDSHVGLSVLGACDYLKSKHKYIIIF